MPETPVMISPVILHVAVPSPLRSLFDYLPAKHEPVGHYQPGMRVQISFGRRQLIGVIVDISQHSDLPRSKLKAVSRLLDSTPVIPTDVLELLKWASSYYHHAPGEVIANGLPAALREGKSPRPGGQQRWLLTDSGRQAETDELRRAPKQAALYQLLLQQPQGLDSEALSAHFAHWRDAMRALIKRDWVVLHTGPCITMDACAGTLPKKVLNTQQQQAVDNITRDLGSFACFLLDGVTGSGKTEVYLEAIDQVIASGKQALVLVPEISLTPQTLARFRGRFKVPVAILHSGLSDGARLCAWHAARSGEAPIVIGTRSAVFTPLANPGMIIIDEEHDSSFKQQDGFRYHARDLAVRRAQQAGIPIVLGSATPSLESLENARQQRYQHLSLSERATGVPLPPIGLIDCRKQPMQNGMSRTLLDAMRAHLARDEQVLLFLNRRGYAPTLMCHACGWTAQCGRCDAQLIVHRQPPRLRCHSCDREQAVPPACPECGEVELRPLGQGTERIEDSLHELFPGHGIIRVDRDSTRKRGAMDALLESVHNGEAQILLGTQMLAKGHDFPRVTLVGVLSADQGLFSIDYRASERMSQLIVQVAGRAGRAEHPGKVLVQTWHPDHPLLQTLVRAGYEAFAEQALLERKEAALPPFARLALLRAEATDSHAPMNFLSEAVQLAPRVEGISLLGPVPAPMERRAGRYRAHLLLQADNRTQLHQLLGRWLPCIEQLKNARKVRWSLDVDPVDML
jgi:primosomal protein N' (replication factor Y)